MQLPRAFYKFIRYAFVDMDADGAQEMIVDFRFGQNDTVMCLVLKEYLDSVYAQPFEFIGICLLLQESRGRKQLCLEVSTEFALYRWNTPRLG